MNGATFQPQHKWLRRGMRLAGLGALGATGMVGSRMGRGFLARQMARSPRHASVIGSVLKRTSGFRKLVRGTSGYLGNLFRAA